MQRADSRAPDWCSVFESREVVPNSGEHLQILGIALSIGMVHSENGGFAVQTPATLRRRNCKVPFATRPSDTSVAFSFSLCGLPESAFILFRNETCSSPLRAMAMVLADLQRRVRQSALKRSSRSLPWVQIAIVSVLVCILFSHVLLDMAKDWWQEPELSQGMLLPPLALFVAWIERRRILSHSAAPDARGLLLVAFACFMLTLGQLASEFFLMRFSFVVLITALVWTFWGARRLRALGFPLLLLAVMVPLPALVYNSLAAPLQLFASDFASQIAQALGVSVFRDGNIIQLAGISLGVAEACSGLSCLSALIVGSLLLGYLLCSRRLSRIVLLIISIPLAIGVNVVRVAGTALLADYNQEFALGFYHTFSGWLVFLVGTLALYGIAFAVHATIDRIGTS